MTQTIYSVDRGFWYKEKRVEFLIERTGKTGLVRIVENNKERPLFHGTVQEAKKYYDMMITTLRDLGIEFE